MQPDSFQNENEAIFLYQNEVNLCDRETKWPPPRFVLQAFAQAAQHKIRLAITIFIINNNQNTKIKRCNGEELEGTQEPHLLYS